MNEDFPKIMYCDARELTGLVNHMVALMNIKVGNTEGDIKAMDEQMLLIGDLLRTEFGNMVTIPEVKQAFKMYVSKQFPDLKIFRILDCIAVSEIVIAFTNYRAEKLRGYYSQKAKIEFIQESTISDKIEQFKILRRGVWKCYLEYLETGTVEDIKFYIFDFLYEIGNLPKQDASKSIAAAYQKKLKSATIQIKRELINKKDNTKRKSDKNDIINQIIKVETGDDKQVEKRAKSLVLIGMFEKLKPEWTIDLSGYRKFYWAICQNIENYK